MGQKKIKLITLKNFWILLQAFNDFSELKRIKEREKQNKLMLS